MCTGCQFFWTSVFCLCTCSLYFTGLKTLGKLDIYFQVTRISSLTQEGIPELWQIIQQYRQLVSESGELLKKRQHQHQVWMWNYIRDHIMELFMKHPSVQADITEVEHRVAKGAMTPGQGADMLLHKFMKDSWWCSILGLCVSITEPAH